MNMAVRSDGVVYNWVMAVDNVITPDHNISLFDLQVRNAERSGAIAAIIYGKLHTSPLHAAALLRGGFISHLVTFSICPFHNITHWLLVSIDWVV